MSLPIELEQEADGRWIAEIPDLPGVLVYGDTPAEAVTSVKALALHLLADRIAHGEPIPDSVAELFAVPA